MSNAPTAASSAPIEAASSEASESNDLSNSLESQEQGANAPEVPAATQKKIEQEIKYLNKLKLKIDGKEIDEELPFELPDDPQVLEYMTRQLQLAKASQKRMSESNQLQKNVEAFITELRKNPRKALSNPSIGVDLKQLAAEILQEEIENSQKSPEQLEREKLEGELKAIREEREREKEESRTRELERLQEQEFVKYDTLISDALDKSGLPKTAYTVKKMADYLYMAVQNNIDVSPADVVGLVQEEMVSDLKEMFSAMPEEVIESVVGKETINKIRKKAVEGVKKRTAPTSPKQIKDVGAANKPKEGKSDKDNKSYRDFFGF